MKKHFKNFIIISVLAFIVIGCRTTTQKPETSEEFMERTKWFRDAKFGMFIHWGVYSLLGKGEWIQSVEKIPVEEYEKLPPQFNPVKYDPDEWISLAEEAGMKYMVFTTKHHDGFGMFDSKLTDFDVMNTPYKKDVTMMLAKACKKRDMKLGFYHSIMDWHHPDYLPRKAWDKRPAEGASLDRYILEFMKGQIKEILTRYGDIVCFFFDGGWDHSAEELHSEEIISYIRSLQPDIMVNDRAHYSEYHKQGILPADYTTPEQNIPATGFFYPDGRPRLWEACVTMTGHWWGYDKYETNFKTPEFLIRMLVDIVSKGGNLLLNVGPMPDGTIQAEFVDRLKAIGRWMDINGEAIYSTTASPFRFLPFLGRCTAKPGKLFFHVFDWPLDGKLRINGLQNAVAKMYLLSDPSVQLKYEKDGNDFIIDVPGQAPDAAASVVVLEIEGSPRVETFINKPDKEGGIMLPALYGEIHGKHGQRAWFATEKNQVYVGNWIRLGDDIEWELEVPKDGRYEAIVKYGCDDKDAGGKFLITTKTDSLTANVVATGGSVNFKEVSAGVLQVKEGKNKLKIEPVEIPKGSPIMNLLQVYLIPKND